MERNFIGMGDEHEFDRHNPEIEWKGPLNGGQENRAVWRGLISASPALLKERFGLSDEKETKGFVDALKERLASFYVLANKSAQVRCIDGRGENIELDEKPALGPEVPGGSPVMAFCYTLANWESRSHNIEKDLERYEARLNELGLPFLIGAHEDEHNAHSEEKTGCGAIDKMLEIIQMMGTRDLMYGVTKSLSGEHFSEEVFDDIQNKLAKLASPNYHDVYFMKDKQSGMHRFGNKLIDKVKNVGHKTKSKTVEKLVGEHNEIFLVINTVSNTTLDRDGFAAETNGKAQAFGYDVWHVIERAKALFEDEDAQKTMIVSNIMYAVATAMALTDGSLEYGIRS